MSGPAICLAWSIAVLGVVPAAGAQGPPAGSLETQPPGASIPLNPGRLTFQYDSEGAAGFLLYVRRDRTDPFRIDLGPAAVRSGAITVDLSDLPDGLYEIEVAAYDRTGQESPRARTDPPQFVMARGKAAKLPPAKEPASRTSVPPPVTPAPETTRVERKKRGLFETLWRVLVGE